MTGIDKIIHDIIQREGGYSDRAGDKGGPTKYGITLSTLAAWRKCTVAIEDVQNLTEDEARQIYLHEYVILPGFLNLRDPYIKELVVDAAVNHGPREAIILLQRAIGAPQDGELGLETLKLLGSFEEANVWFKFMGQRLRYYASIIAHDGSQCVFAQGWLNRCIDILSAHSAEMVLEAGGKTTESITALGLAASFAIWSKQLHPIEKAKANAYGTFLRAGGDCLAAAAKFK